ncbi:unnamed protein product [Trichogramma brassicae]|uniref:C2H2-type domain-containing protein n=1 Tax=Trichogramma brassicae TaxID=86971 RepID=A0A6H5I3U7_9HYME|nr:unnamed protein product [Trichogramma brassicae]
MRQLREEIWTKIDLLLHQKTVHESRKDYECYNCEKKFGKKSDLLRHQRTVHEGRKDDACNECGKIFGRKSTLLFHQRTVHESREDLTCDKCEKKCGRKSHLLFHQKTVHEGRKDFACDKCEKKFGKKSHLLDHQKIVHESRKDYACDKCEKKYGHKSSLVVHQKTAHKGREDNSYDKSCVKFGGELISSTHQKCKRNDSENDTSFPSARKNSKQDTRRLHRRGAHDCAYRERQTEREKEKNSTSRRDDFINALYVRDHFISFHFFQSSRRARRAKHKLLCNGHAPCCIFNFSTQEGDLNEMSVAVNSDLYNTATRKRKQKKVRSIADFHLYFALTISFERAPLLTTTSLVVVGVATLSSRKLKQLFSPGACKHSTRIPFSIQYIASNDRWRVVRLSVNTQVGNCCFYSSSLRMSMERLGGTRCAAISWSFARLSDQMNEVGSFSAMLFSRAGRLFGRWARQALAAATERLWRRRDDSVDECLRHM